MQLCLVIGFQIQLRVSHGNKLFVNLNDYIIPVIPDFNYTKYYIVL